MNFSYFDLPLWVDDEGAAQCQTLFLNQHTKVACNRLGGVADHRVLNFLDGVGRVVPSLVSKMRVARNRVNLAADFLELVVEVGEGSQFGRAHEGKTGRVEHDH